MVCSMQQVGTFRALWIRVDPEMRMHTARFVTVARDENELARIQHAVGGYIEVVQARRCPIKPDLEFYINEEGLLRRLPSNAVASVITGTVLVGDALVCQGVDKKGEVVGLTSESECELREIITTVFPHVAWLPDEPLGFDAV